MVDGPYSRSPDAYGSHPDARKSASFADKIAARRQERFESENPEQADNTALKSEVAELKVQIAAIWTMFNTAHGAGGINVAWPVIAYTGLSGTGNINGNTLDLYYNDSGTLRLRKFYVV